VGPHPRGPLVPGLFILGLLHELDHSHHLARYQIEFLLDVHSDFPTDEMAALRFLRRSGGQCAVLHLDPGRDPRVHGASSRTDVGAVRAEPKAGARAESEYSRCVYESGAGFLYLVTTDCGGGEAAAADAEEGLGYGGVFNRVHVSPPSSPFLTCLMARERMRERVCVRTSLTSIDDE